MPRCNKCEKIFPNRVIINGKERVLNKRKYCLECSLFGMHNTRKIHISNIKEGKKICCICKKEMLNLRRNVCQTCRSKQRRIKIKKRIIELYGARCKICGYGNEEKFSMLDFHHVYPENKIFNINANNMACKNWKSVVLELQKCIMLCCRCHREFHAGLISFEIIEDIFLNQFPVVQW